jgi:hypothetical protein
MLARNKFFVLALAFVVVFAVGAGTASADSILYATDGSGGTLSNLYTVNATTGATSLVGAVGFAVNGLEYHNGTLYGLERAGGSLISINTSTGAGTAIGPLGFRITGFAIDSAGNAFGWHEPSQDALYRINLTTGAASFVGDPGLSTASHGLAFIGSTLYMHNLGTVYTINTTTGGATVVGSTGLGREAHHGDVNPDNGLYYGINWSPSGSSPAMNLIDLATATASGSVSTDRQLHTLAFAVPEPSVFALLGIGFALVAWRLRKKRINA